MMCAPARLVAPRGVTRRGVAHRLGKDVDADTAASKRPNQLRARANSVDSGSELLEETRISNFLPTSRRIVQFSEGRAPKPTDRVVYVTGSWDLFNSGHMKVRCGFDPSCRGFFTESELRAVPGEGEPAG